MKKFNKNIFICALLVAVMLFSVSAISAEDTALDDNLASSDAGDVVSASGDTIYVDSSSTSNDEQWTESNPYKTISAAVNSDNVTGGETIFIKNGNYSESARIELPANKPLSFIGESQEGVKITSTATNGFIYSIQSGTALYFKNLTFFE